MISFHQWSRSRRARRLVTMAAALVSVPGVLPSQSVSPAATTLRVRGLRQPVEVRRDRWGVPHIYAATQHDLFFAQGFVVAQDRLFQMEMWRRQGEGRLAEVLGPAAIERDRYARLFAYRGDMAREWQAYAPDTRAIVTAFVDGVNAYIAEARDSLPVEFGLLGFRPEPWTPAVVLTRTTGLSGAGNASTEILRARLVERLGVERAQDVLRPDPYRPFDPVPGLDLAGIVPAVLGAADATMSDIAYARIEGSNNWVVSGAKTVTGKPILANDPHRIITNPAVRYITHLVAPGWNVIGSGEPGSPGVAIGHNDRIAFGLTVVGMDQEDLYVERVRACAAPSGRCVATARGWVPVRRRSETIRVKGASDRRVHLEFTPHGPIVGEDSARGRVFALRRIDTEPGTAAYLASLSLDRARNWEEFSSAMNRWKMPSENMIYADVDGNIGWIAAGIMPKRSWSGLLPVTGDGGYEWKGFVPGAELPRAFNPAAQYIATANHNILPAGYPIPLSYEWASRYRIDRLHDVLGQPKKFSVEDFKQLQHDDYSKLAEALVPALTDAATRRQQTDHPDVARLTSWDFRLSRQQRAPLLFAAWVPALYRRALARRQLGQAIDLVASATDNEWVEQIVKHPPAYFGENPAATRDSMMLDAVEDAARTLEQRFGGRWRMLTWGEVHTANFRHPLSAKYDLPGPSRGGDGNTVFATGGRDFGQSSGASYRQIIDLADFDNSVATNTPGQSANPASPHYRDLLALWGRDEYFPLIYSRQRVEQETESVLWLRPTPGR